MKREALSSQSYNNKFEWASVFRIVCFILGLALLVVLIFLFVDLIFDGRDGFIITHHELDPYKFWPIFIFFLIILSCMMTTYLLIASTGEYSISGNQLIVHERYMFNTTITIPIGCISEVRYTPYFGSWNSNTLSFNIAPFHYIEITVYDKKYTLHSITCQRELYDELVNRINNNAKM